YDDLSVLELVSHAKPTAAPRGRAVGGAFPGRIGRLPVERRGGLAQPLRDPVSARSTIFMVPSHAQGSDEECDGQDDRNVEQVGDERKRVVLGRGGRESAPAGSHDGVSSEAGRNSGAQSSPSPASGRATANSPSSSMSPAARSATRATPTDMS